MKTVFLFICCWAAIEYTTAEELSKNVLDFLVYKLGDADNKAQVELKGQEYDLVQARVRRVHVPFLEPNVTLFIEQATNGVITFFQLGLLTEFPNNTLTMKLYNFTDYTNIKFATYDLDKISQLKPEQLQSDDECVASFEIWGRRLMTGIYPNCRYTNDEKHPSVIVTYTCDFSSVLYPVNTDQKSASAPYVLQRHYTGEKLEGAPSDYTSPCNN